MPLRGSFYFSTYSTRPCLSLTGQGAAAHLSLGEALLRARSWGRLANQDLRLTDPDLSELAVGAATALCPLAEALRAHRFVERARQALAPTDEARVALIGERTRSAIGPSGDAFVRKSLSSPTCVEQMAREAETSLSGSKPLL